MECVFSVFMMNIHTIMLIYFMILSNVSILFMYVYESQLCPVLYGQDDVDVNLDTIYFENEFDSCHLGVK